MKNKGKKLDALELKDKVQKAVLKETANLSADDEIAFYREAARNGPFADLLSRLEKKAKSRRKAG
jgi:hypothetical protein